jgi:type I restriction enzyme S subunit
MRTVPMWALARRIDVTGRPDLPRLSVYRDHGVVLTNSRDDNFNKAGEDLGAYKVVQPGQLVLNKMKTWQGSLGVSQHEGIVSPAYFVCDLPGSVDGRFLHYLLRSQPYIAAYASMSKGIRPNQWDLPWEAFRQIEVALPGSTEQRRIADFLDDQVARLDAAKGTTGEVQLRLREREGTAIREGVAGVLHLTRESSPLPWLDGLGAGTTLRPLGRVLRLQRGTDLTADEQVPGAYPVVTTAGPSGTHHRPVVRRSGVVVGRYGSVGNVHWIDGPHWAHNTTLYVSDYMGNDPRYVYYLLRAYPWDALHNRSAVPGVNRNDMKNDLVPVVALSEQGRAVRRIEELLSQIASSGDAAMALGGLLEERKRALITACVTGEFDISTASSHAADAAMRSIV